MSKKGKNECIFYASVVLITAISAFLSGYGFNKFVAEHTLHNVGKRSLEDIINIKNVHKRNFESRDRTPGDEAAEKLQQHIEGIEEINATYIDEMLQFFTKEPHMGGTKENTDLGKYMLNEWKKLGYDEVESKEYSVLLSLPRKPANVTVMNEKGDIVKTLKTVEEAFFPGENSTKSVYPFNAYTASGTVEGEYVFVNYGEVRDFAWLKEHNISVDGKIVIARYGRTFRGVKVQLAQEYGAVGVLLYPDPQDYVEGNNPGYPETWDLPRNAIPRGNVVSMKGDPLTPLYAATDGAFRLNEKNIGHFPKIVVTPISYADAYDLLSQMDGLEVPDPNWQGGLNFTYRINSNVKRYMRMEVDVPKEQRNIQNIVATIKGETEPDRLVIIGNHRDAWVFGAGDPSSGTACMMAISRALGKMLENGWRPRRTFMLISWDAEEPGLMGSTEYVQEFHSVLEMRTVAYINVDIAVSGNHTIRAKASPLLMDKFYNVTKQFLDPDLKPGSTRRSLYEMWKKKKKGFDPGEPKYTYLGSGSDFTPFYSTYGIACLDLRYEYNSDYHPADNYPTYHTIYDNYQYFKTFIDPDFRYHTLIAKVWMRYAVEIADDLILPFNLTRYARRISEDANMFSMSFEELLRPQNITLGEVLKAAYELEITAEKFHERLNDLNENDCYAVRRMNDQMMFFEKAFIFPDGLPTMSNIKHLIYSPSRKSLFSRKVFPGLTQILYDIEIHNMNLWDQLREQISLLAAIINNAKYTLYNFGQL